MNWIFIAYLLALIYLTANGARFASPGSLQMAWRWFAMIPISHFIFALFRAGNLRNPHDLALVEVWADGIEWLLLGLSTFCLSKLTPSNRNRGDEPFPPIAK